MARSTTIANLAISHLGTGKRISNVDTDSGQEAVACRTHYETTLRATLRDFDWSFATKIAALGLIEEDPNDEWEYSYRYPSDCVKMRRILSGTRNDSRQSRVSYKIGNDDTARLIWSDEITASAEYTKYIDDEKFYSEDFVMAFSLRLAANIAAELTEGDIFSIRERIMDRYREELSSARPSADNEEQPEEEPDSEFERARS